MKIDTNRTQLDSVTGTTRTDATQDAAATQKARTAGETAADQVTLSAGAQLATAAVDAAQKSSDVRPDVVERAKKLLAEGKIGNDAERLADSLIDATLKD